MPILSLTDATVTPSGETRPFAQQKGDQRLYIHAEGCLFELTEVSQAPGFVSPIARPPVVLFGAVRDPQIRVRTPFLLEIKTEGDTVTAYCPEIEEFGYGKSLTEALDDFGKTVRELYTSLVADQHKLGEDLRKTLLDLSAHLEHRRLPA